MHIRSTLSLVSYALVAGLGLSACHRTAQQTPNGAYAAPPTNTIKAAVDTTIAALNRRDSVAYWNSFTYETRDWRDSRAAAQKLWDSSAGSRVAWDLLYTQEFTKHVHSAEDIARFGHALINIRFEGDRNRHFDSLITILRADSGRWLVGQFTRVTHDGQLEDVQY